MFEIFNLVVLLATISIFFFAFPHIKGENKKMLIKAGIAGILSGVVLNLILFPHFSVVVALNTIASAFLFILTLFMSFYFTSQKEVRKSEFYDDGIPARYYITGDKHRDFNYVKKFCSETKTRPKDVLIILGDAGFNYYGDERDDELKTEASKMSITLFCLHGNKENRPENVGGYGIRNFCGGKVYYEPKYPNILFAMDGSVYTFDNREYLVVGGAHSIDKQKCLEENLPYWEDEMPSFNTKQRVEKILSDKENKIYGVLTHTCPLKYLPTEMFLSSKRKSNNKKRKFSIRFPFKKANKKFELDIDRSTETWLDQIENTLDYTQWFCGHYHIDKEIDKVNMMCWKIKPLYSDGDKNEYIY